MRTARAVVPATMLLVLCGGALGGATAADAALRADAGRESWWPELETEPEEHGPGEHDGQAACC